MIAQRVFDLVADAAQVWVTFVLFALGVQFALYWWRTRRRLEEMRGRAVLAPPDLKESKLAALLASGMFAGTVVSFGVMLAEAFWGGSAVVVAAANYGCILTGNYFVWRLAVRVEEKLRVSRRPRYARLRRWRVPSLLHGSGYVLAAFAVAALALAIAVPTVDPRADTSAWGFAYRWTAAGPGLVFVLLVAALFAEAARAKVGGELKAVRWRYGAWGSLGFAGIWLNHLLWPYVALYYPECWAGQNYAGLERLLEAPIFAFLGVAFFRAFTKEFRSGEADKDLERSISFRRLSERVSFVLSGWAVFSQKLTDDYYESVSLLEKTLARLGVGPEGAQLAADALALRAAREAEEISEVDLRRLHLHHVLDVRGSGSPGSADNLGRPREPRRRLPCPVRALTARPTAGLGKAYGPPARRPYRPTAAFAGAPTGCFVPGTPARPNLLAHAAGPVVALPESGGAPDLPGLPVWQQAYVVVAAMSGLLPRRSARQVLDPRGKNHALRTQRVAYEALAEIAGDGDLLPLTKAYGVLSDLFGEQVEEVIARATPGSRGPGRGPRRPHASSLST